MAKERDKPRLILIPGGRDHASSSGPNLIKTEDDIDKIRHTSEQEFARFLLRKNPHLIIIYEPQTFEYTPENSPTKATLPDFLIINPHNSDKPVYVEITCAERGSLYDVKQRQKMVMQHAAPEARYVVLYKENLVKMQRKHPEFKPFHGTKRAA